MISNAQVWRAVPPSGGFLIAGETFQLWLHGEKLHLPWLLPPPLSVPQQTCNITIHTKTSSWLILVGMSRVIASRRSDWQWRIVPITRWPLLHIVYFSLICAFSNPFVLLDRDIGNLCEIRPWVHFHWIHCLDVAQGCSRYFCFHFKILKSFDKNLFTFFKTFSPRKWKMFHCLDVAQGSSRSRPEWLVPVCPQHHPLCTAHKGNTHTHTLWYTNTQTHMHTHSHTHKHTIIHKQTHPLSHS